MIKRFLVTLLTLTMFLGLPTISLAQAYKSGDPYLTKAQLKQYGPVRLKVGATSAIRVISLNYPADPTQNCRLDVKALRKMLSKQVGSEAWSKAVVADGPITVELKAVVQGEEVVCIPGGTGCIVTIKPEEKK